MGKRYSKKAAEGALVLLALPFLLIAGLVGSCGRTPAKQPTDRQRAQTARQTEPTRPPVALVSQETEAPPQAEATPDPEPVAEIPKPEARQWTDSTGKFSVVATFAGLADGKVSLSKADGNTVAVPLDRLSEADKRHVDSVAVKIIGGKVVGLADGDTITVLQDKTQYKIRLEGIDAPESGQAYGTQARKSLADKVFQKDVEVKWQTKDKYGRTLGDVYLDQRWINKELVEEGWAWHYKQYSKSTALAQAEAEARAQKRGLWKDPDPVSPWDFRHKPSTALAPDPSTALLPTDKPDQTDRQDQTVYVTKTGAKYHTAGCRYLAKSSIPIALSEAKKRYTPCSVCGAGLLGSRESEPKAEPRPDPSTSVSSPPSSSGDRVQVRGYYRKDGTYVRPHTRSRPSK